MEQNPNGNKECDVEIQWKGNTAVRDGNYKCKYCAASGRCPACIMMEQEANDGDCYNCQGEGFVIYRGKTRECPNCEGTKKCPICEGSTDCDRCDGKGEIHADKIAKLAGGRASRREPEPISVDEDEPEESDPEE